MKYAAAALLLSMGPDPTIDSKRIRTVLESVGIEPDEGKLKHFIERFGDNKIDNLIEAGQGKMATFGVGAPGGATAGSNVGTDAASGKQEAKEEKKEEKQEEEEEEDFGFGLFD